LEVESLKHENPTFHGDTIYAESTVLDKNESSSKPDRGIVYVETRGFNQRGERVCIYRRKVMVPKKEHYPDLQPADLTPEQSEAEGLLQK
jgi:acyl dehydratase